ncbi:MAG: hypothetical protein E6Q36_05700 [Chryseobacterium sp.]|nr:MAG: hypothetical protein E6Q36_05700 [Chryseobacterium sp.]
MDKTILVRLEFRLDDYVLTSKWGVFAESEARNAITSLAQTLPALQSLEFNGVEIDASVLGKGQLKFQLARFTPDIYEEVIIGQNPCLYISQSQ